MQQSRQRLLRRPPPLCRSGGGARTNASSSPLVGRGGSSGRLEKDVTDSAKQHAVHVDAAIAIADALTAPPHPLSPAARKSDPDRLELLAELREALLRCQVGSGAVLADAAHGLSQRGELRRGERVEGGVREVAHLSANLVPSLERSTK